MISNNDMDFETLWERRNECACPLTAVQMEAMIVRAMAQPAGAAPAKFRTDRKSVV